MRTMSKMQRRPYLLFIAIFLVQWLLLFSAEHPEWDGVFYYAYARSIVMDGDLQLANDIELSYSVTSERFAKKAFHTIKTTTGYLDNPFPVGPAIVWMPWLLLTRIFTNAVGYERYILAVQSAMPAFAGFAAYLLSYRITRSLTSRKAATVAVATMMFATPLIYYQFVEPFFSHALSALVTTLCVSYWWRNRDDSATFAVTLGMLVGGAALVRWQNGMYLLLIGIPAAIDTLKSRRRFPLMTRNVLLAVFGFLVVMTIQFTMWQIFFDSWLTIPQGDSFMDWSAPRLWPTLFSTYRGLLFWMPIFFPALLGLVLLSRRNLTVGLTLISILLFEVYVNASTYDWFAGGGYGPRRFTSELAILIIGYAVLLDSLFARWQMSTLVGAIFALHQWVLLRFGLVELIGGRIVVFTPDYMWDEDSASLFWSKLTAHLPQLWREPQLFFVAHNSPLDRLLSGISLRWQLYGLMIAALLWVAIVLIGRRLSSRYPVRNILVAGIGVGCVVFWVLLFA